MKTTTQQSASGLKVKSALKGGGFGPNNHNKSALKVKSALKGGGFGPNNHNRLGLKVRAGIKAGSCLNIRNHNAQLLPCR